MLALVDGFVNAASDLLPVWMQTCSMPPGFRLSVYASALGFLSAHSQLCRHYHITFQSGKRHDEAIVRLFSVAIVGLVLNTMRPAWCKKET